MLHDNTTPLAAIGFEQWKPDGARMTVCALLNCDLLQGPFPALCAMQYPLAARQGTINPMI